MSGCVTVTGRRRDLLFEQRQNRAVGTKHIAEAHRYKFGFAFLRQRLDDHLAQAFCRTHHVGGIHRLVRRDENKTPHTVFVRRKRHIVGAEHVVLTASSGASSINGTCLCAAAWNTTSG